MLLAAWKLAIVPALVKDDSTLYYCDIRFLIIMAMFC